METDRMAEAVIHFKLAKKFMLQRPKEKQKPRFLEYLDQLINDFEDPTS